MKLRHLREDTEQPSLGGIWYVRFRPAGYAGEPWEGDKAVSHEPRVEVGRARHHGLFFRALSLRPALAGAAGVVGIAALTAVLWVP